jgi:hypothetical protein
MTQAEIVFPPYQKASATSKAGAAHVFAHAPGIRARVVAYVETCSAAGATRDEIAHALSLRLSSVCGRVAEAMDERRGVPTLHRSGRVRISRIPGASNVPAEIILSVKVRP